MEVLRHLFTGRDNTTHDLGRYSWALSFLSVVCLAGWNVMHGQAETLHELAESLGLVAGAHGAALFLKRDTEPKEPS